MTTNENLCSALVILGFTTKENLQLALAIGFVYVYLFVGCWIIIKTDKKNK